MHTLWEALKRFDRDPTEDEVAVARNSKPPSCLPYSITSGIDAIFDSTNTRPSTQMVCCAFSHIFRFMVYFLLINR